MTIESTTPEVVGSAPAALDLHRGPAGGAPRPAGRRMPAHRVPVVSS